MLNTEAPPILSRCGPCIYFASKFPLFEEYGLAPFYVALGTNISSQTPHPMKDLRLSNYQKLHVPQIDNELIEVEGQMEYVPFERKSISSGYFFLFH